VDFSSKFTANKYKRSKFSDFSSWNTAIKNRLNELAENYITKRPKKLVEPSVNMKITYQSELNSMQDIGLCDTVKVVYGISNLTHTAQVIKTVYDSINEKYVEMEIGEKKLYLNNYIKKTNRRLL
jgi:phage-related protein